MQHSRHFVELNKQIHDRKSFDCGNPELNGFLQRFAVRHREAGISKTMVLPAESDPTQICAFYTLSHTELKRQSLPADFSKKLPYYPIPVMLIAQLAVHINVQNSELGKITLIKALEHSFEITRHLPSYAIVVDALDDNLIPFYEQYGFQPLDVEDSRKRLFIPIKIVARLFA